MKKILMVLASLLLIVTVGCKEEERTPEEQFADGVIKTMEQKNMELEYTTAYDFSSNVLTAMEPSEDLNPAVIELLNGLSLTLNSKIILDNPDKLFDVSYDYSIAYKDGPLLRLAMVADNERIGFGMTDFYDKYFTVNFKDIMALASQVSLSGDVTQLDFQKYINIIMDKSRLEAAAVDFDIYKHIFREYLKDSVTYAGEESITYNNKGKMTTEDAMAFDFDYDIERFTLFFEELVKAFEEDDQLKTYIQTVIIDVLKELKDSGDYATFGLSSTEVQEAIDTFRSEYDEEYAMMLDELQATVDEMSEELSLRESQDLNELTEIKDAIELRFFIIDGLLRQVHMDMDYEGMGFSFTSDFVGFGDDVIIQHDQNKEINIFDFIDPNTLSMTNQEELASMGKEFVMSALDHMMTDESYLTLYEDLKPLESEIGMDPSTIPYMLGMAKSYVEHMTIDEIIMYLNQMNQSQY